VRGLGSFHEPEDEYSFVLEGRMGAVLGDETVYAEAGEFVFKPRNQWHTFWNAGNTACRVLEIISPAGFEHFFDELAELIAEGASAAPDQRAGRAVRPLLRLREDAAPHRGARPPLRDAPIADAIE
jgi:hypothetical protein